MASAKASTVAPSAVPGWSRLKMLRTNARSIERRFFDANSASFFLRSVSVGLPCPVQTNASSASRATRSGCRSANSAAFSAPEEIPYTRSLRAPLSRSIRALPALRSSAPLAISKLIGRCLSERP
jgi:hypothetical protein